MRIFLIILGLGGRAPPSLFPLPGISRALTFSLSPGLRPRNLYGQSGTKETSAEEFICHVLEEGILLIYDFMVKKDELSKLSYRFVHPFLDLIRETAVNNAADRDQRQENSE